MTEPPPKKHHLLITGTGRAGTSFLVRYFDTLGLHTHFSRFGEHASWNEDANAGAEDLPLSALDDQLPYVVKSPWASEFVDQLLADDGIALDAVIIPMRDLMDAASSRTIVELRDVAEKTDFSLKLDRPWAHRGQTPGGIVFSLHPLDQARVLALGFHHMVERLVAADVNIVFLSFPRLVRDAGYLHEKLEPVLALALNRPVGLAEATQAHAEVADPGKVRVEREARDETLDRLDRIALNREIERLRGRVSSLEDETTTLRNHADGLQRHAAAIESSRLWRAPLARFASRCTRSDLRAI